MAFSWPSLSRKGGLERIFQDPSPITCHCKQLVQLVLCRSSCCFLTCMLLHSFIDSWNPPLLLWLLLFSSRLNLRVLKLFLALLPCWLSPLHRSCPGGAWLVMCLAVNRGCTGRECCFLYLGFPVVFRSLHSVAPLAFSLFLPPPSPVASCWSHQWLCTLVTPGPSALLGCGWFLVEHPREAGAGDFMLLFLLFMTQGTGPAEHFIQGVQEANKVAWWNTSSWRALCHAALVQLRVFVQSSKYSSFSKTVNSSLLRSA